MASLYHSLNNDFSLVEDPLPPAGQSPGRPMLNCYDGSGSTVGINPTRRQGFTRQPFPGSRTFPL